MPENSIRIVARLVANPDSVDQVRSILSDLVEPTLNESGCISYELLLKKYFSDYKFDGKRLVLKSKGSYSESESGKEKMKLSWNVDLDLPVFREVKR